MEEIEAKRIKWLYHEVETDAYYHRISCGYCQKPLGIFDYDGESTSGLCNECYNIIKLKIRYKKEGKLKE